eukprot:COSAG05_NODE_85_length_20698_cov_35.370309_5_plen_64_part_00
MEYTYIMPPIILGKWRVGRKLLRGLVIALCLMWLTASGQSIIMHAIREFRIADESSDDTYPYS